MIPAKLACSLSLALLALAPAAHAQYGGADVLCESHDGRTQQCRTPFRNPVVGEQLSSSDCIEGRTWGMRGNGAVWVTGGCRARFVEGRGGWQGGGGQGQNVLRCESEDGRYQSCAAPRGARLVISRQLSETRCVEGRNWGTRGNSVWVDGGCRAEFTVSGGGGGSYGPGPGYGPGPSYGGQVTCESQDRRQQSCDWNSRWGRPQVIEQLSEDTCREGQSWGWDGRSRIWVDRGCRARFGGR